MLCVFNFITTRQYLISVTTKDEFWISLGRKGKTPQPLSASTWWRRGWWSRELPQYLDWHYDTHLGINNKKEEEIGCIKPYQNWKKKQIKKKTFPLVSVQVSQQGAWKLHPYNSLAQKLLFTYPFWH